jgi:hypothetical protein
MHPWRVAAGVFVAIFMPIIPLWTHIDFDPARFTELWIQSGLTGVVLYFVITLAISEKAHLDAREQSVRIVRRVVAPAFSRFANELSAVENTGQLSADSVARLHGHWHNLVSMIQNGTMIVLPDDAITAEMQVLLRTVPFKIWEQHLNQRLSGRSRSASALLDQLHALQQSLLALGSA